MLWNSVRTAVVPVDLEEPQNEALRLALQATAPESRVTPSRYNSLGTSTSAASSSEGQVHVVYVLPTLEPSLITQIPPTQRISTATQNLKQWLTSQDAPSRVVPQVTIGPAAQEIVALADGVGADLIVLPSHRRRGVARAFVGSVASRVVRLSTIPVLVL
ncbi:MAG: universal stress protein [Myxococcales bacterium]|nr:universal stress protein [Myxococcales bacterium]